MPLGVPKRVLSRSILTLIITAFSTGLAYAESVRSACERTIDLREPGAAMEKMPVTSQGYTSTNLCGFYSSSAMIDAWRKTALHPNSRFISPIALGVELAIKANVPIWFPIQNTTDPLTTVSGRWGQMVCPILKFARVNGACADPALRADDLEISARLADKTTAIYSVLFKFGMKSKRDQLNSLDQTVSTVHQMFLEMAPKPLYSVDILDLKKWISENEEKPYKTIYQLFFRSCDRPENRVTLADLPECQSAYFGGLDFFGIHIGDQDPLRTDGALKKIREYYNTTAQPRPIAVAFCGSILREGKSYPGYSILSDACSAHWVLLMGRKMINGKCHYLLRNTAKPVFEYSKDWTLDGRDVWIEEEYFNRSIYALQWLAD